MSTVTLHWCWKSIGTDVSWCCLTGWDSCHGDFQPVSGLSRYTKYIKSSASLSWLLNVWHCKTLPCFVGHWTGMLLCIEAAGCLGGGSGGVGQGACHGTSWTDAVWLPERFPCLPASPGRVSSALPATRAQELHPPSAVCSGGTWAWPMVAGFPLLPFCPAYLLPWRRVCPMVCAGTRCPVCSCRSIVCLLGRLTGLCWIRNHNCSLFEIKGRQVGGLGPRHCTASGFPSIFAALQVLVSCVFKK